MRPRVNIPFDAPGVPHDVPITFVTSELQGDVHAFIPESFNVQLVNEIAHNFSSRVQQPVQIFHDPYRQKYRLCPIPHDATLDSTNFGTFCFVCDASIKPTSKQPKCDGEVQADEPVKAESSTSQERERRIPRPRNQWILYRQAMSQDVAKQNPGITAAEISTIISKMWKEELPHVKQYWQAMAAEEDRKHKEMYPNYKYTTRKSPAKKNQNNAQQNPEPE